MDNNLRLEMESLVTTENVSLYFFLPQGVSWFILKSFTDSKLFVPNFGTV